MITVDPAMIAALLFLLVAWLWYDAAYAFAVEWTASRRARRARGSRPVTPSPAFIEEGRWVVACPACRIAVHTVSRSNMGHPGDRHHVQRCDTCPGRGCSRCQGHGTLPVLRLRPPFLLTFDGPAPKLRAVPGA